MATSKTFPVIHEDLDPGEDPFDRIRGCEYLIDPEGTTRKGLISWHEGENLAVATFIKGTGEPNYNDMYLVPRGNVIATWAW